MRKIIISAFLAVLGGICKRAGLMSGIESAQGIRWRLNYIHSMKYAEVINASIAANSAGIDYSSRSSPDIN